MNNFKYSFLFSFLLANGTYDISSHNTGQLWNLRLNQEFSNFVIKSSDEYHLDEKKLVSVLARSPLINKKERSDILIDFPSPEGEFINFEMYESPVMPPHLSVKYPMIKTYTGRGLDNPNDRVSVTINNNEIKIDFNFKNLVSPYEVLESPDGRKLGMLIKNIKIIPI